MTTDIIAIHGLKGAGKDTVAKMIHKYRPQMTPWAFADKLKAIAAVAHNLPQTWFRDEKLKEQPFSFLPVGFTEQDRGSVTPRAILKLTADMYKAKFGADFFAQELERIAKSSTYANGIIVTDLRAYDGEERAVCDALRAKVLHVIRPHNDLYEPDLRHGSEKALELKPNDFVIRNDGTLHDLLLKVRTAIVEMYGKPALAPYPYVPPPDEPLTNLKT